MLTSQSRHTSELVEMLENLKAQHDKYAAITADFARAIDALHQVAVHLGEEDGAGRALATVFQGNAPSIPETPVTRPAMRNVSWAERLDGLTHMEALIYIAEDCGGTIRTTEARDILIKAGLTKGKARNVNSSVTRLLIESDQFERVEPGLYRMKSMNEGEESGSIDLGSRQYPLTESIDNT